MAVSLKDSVVLVVGASSGMGRETALQFARERAKVMASARREDRLLELKRHHEIEIYPADATDPAAMEALAAATLEKFGRIDILVYAAGTNTPDRALTRLKPAIWDIMLSVNLSGAYYATQAVLPRMRDRQAGLIFYISSRSAIAPDESGAAYQAAKRGLIGLSQAVRLEEKGNGIRTCVVCPGLADTEILEKRLVKPPEETLAKALRAEDVAELVLAVAKLPARTWVPEVHLFPAEL
jgi:NADP-dependent 3-hydroxy acid dehydrogenase YdfG